MVVLFGFLLLSISTLPAQAQDAHIYLDSTAQIIRGFGAANIVGWRPDMTDDEIETAFGAGEGQLGFSLLRIRIPPDEDQWNVNVRAASRAHDMGVTLIASPWSPPARMKTNGNVVGGRLRDDMYDDFAAYLDDFATFMAENGAPLYAVSVQNEPDIQVSYESCDYSPSEMARFVREHASGIDTRVIAPESFQFRRSMSDPLLNDPEALENLDIVGGHIYGGGLSAYPLAREKGKEVWMTEHLDTNTDFEAVMGTAVEMQNVMQAGMSAYIWWYIVRYYGPISDGEEGSYRKGEVTKRGYVMSQFARFIRPGAVRVHADAPTLSGLSVTAYRDSARVVVVAVNDAAVPLSVRFNLEGGSVGDGVRYVTSQTQNAERSGEVSVSNNRFAANLSAKSVTTFVLGKGDGGSISRPPHRLLQNYPNPFHASTSITYALTSQENVKLEVFDLMGRKLATLEDGTAPPGNHPVEFHGRWLPPGTYFYRLTAGDVVQTRTMTIAR